MEGERLPGAADPSRFPGKLWQLVNSSRFGCVRWDARGEGLLIDLQVPSRPPQRCQRLLGTALPGDPLLPPWTLGEAARPGIFCSHLLQRPKSR